MLKRKVSAAIVCGLMAGLAAGCGGKKQQVDTVLLSPRETYRVAREEIQRGNLRHATEILGLIDYRLGEDRALLEPLVRITTADATFYQNNDIALIDARALYLDYVTLYADHELAPYALYQAGVCSLSQVSAPSKDQTETYQAIRDLRDVEARFPDSSYAVAARLMRRLAESRLVEHELTVGRYYMKKKAYPSSLERFQKALGQYPDSSKTGDLFLAIGDAMMRSGDIEQGRFYLDRVISDYPGTGLDTEAQKIIKNTSAQLAKN